MDQISYAHSAKQSKRIKRFIAEPDSTSGLVSLPKVIEAGENITIPDGRVVVHPNLEIAGTLTIENDGELFVPFGGTLVSSDLMHPVDTIDDLRNETGKYKYIYVTGYHTKDDGAFGSNMFVWDEGSTETDNGGTIIKCTTVTTGRYKLKYSGAVNVKWFDSFQSAVSFGGELNISDDITLFESILIEQSNTSITMDKDVKIWIDSTFTDSEVFRIGFLSDYIADGGFDKVTIDFSNCTSDIDVFNFRYVARWTGRDILVIGLVGTMFAETSVGHEHTWENITVRSAQVANGAGIYVNMTDSYFANLKPIGFSEYGIVNDGADNRFHGCHPWSYSRSTVGFSNYTTKILFWDKEDGMWTDCYADTFEREDSGLPPSFDNGGIAYYFSKVSGMGRMVNCGFYSLDTDVGSVIGIGASSVVQQINVTNGYILGSNPTAYEAFVKREATSTMVNLFGCNFSEYKFQAKETLSGSDIVASNQIYNRFLGATEFATLETNLKTWKDRRADYSTIVFKDATTSIDPYYWDYRTNTLKRLNGSDSWISPTLLNGWVNAGSGGATAQYRKDANGMVHIKGYIGGGTTTLGTSIFTLPSGFRPSEALGYAQTCGTSYNQVASIGINTSGSVYILSCPSAVNLTINISFKL